MGRAFALNIMMKFTRDNGQKIDAAFELMRKRDSESFTLACVCAVYDRPYTLRFKRKANGLFGLVESAKPNIERTSSGSDGVQVSLVASLKVPLEQIEMSGFPCAWCGDNGFHHCAHNCGALVCGGRMQGETFHCRSSCGASWVGVPLKQVEGEQRQELRRPSMPAAARVPSAPSGPSEPRLMLGTGGSALVRRDR